MIDGTRATAIPKTHPSLRDGHQSGLAGRPAPDQFSAGQNRMLAAALRPLLDDIGKSYSPLVLYGLSGVEKSLIRDQVTNRWQSNHPNANIVVASGAEFVQALGEAVRTQTTSRFRSRFRAAQLLYLDGLEALVTKPETQHELTRVLDEVHAYEAAVVCTIDSHPQQIAKLVPTLRSRLLSGVVVELHAPELADKCAPPNTVGVPAIIDAAAAYFALKPAQLRSKSRNRSIVAARRIAIYLARQLTGKSFQKIGDSLGRRDHTTILHSFHKAEELMQADRETQLAVQEVKRLLT